ncbi:VOC family protein [Leptospira sp. 201903070]|jgi:catechol 2,3-dioxygenase-like lactoylglutathione lyase family enzyme|uniref:VOC family protein n=1 Tax=Leptospira ainlahdjerensis TaxID=2810033 RepID=A0ABS2UGV4_9LEPT|nr:VOC family protein [Leptospira ainlahdjerensis]MBM9579625.1 VOC family protein [Leptospira ainlahdjerensis]
MIHHIAIGTPNLKILSDFYATLPGLKKIKDHWNEDNSLRSTWFQAGDTILMLESDTTVKGPKALIFSAASLEPSTINCLPKWIQETEYTKYFKDPDENLIGYSSYPDSWPF